MAASKVYRLSWRAMPALAAGLIGGLLGCASRGSDALPTGRADNPQPPAGAPSLTELQQQLDEEFLRLGIDPTKVTAAAPQGTRNAVFDLSAQAVDADGQPWTPGGDTDPPAGIELRWTERLLGDYDQNGEVNAADLAPLSPRFLQSVSYNAPALHGGFAEWPSGDPEGSGAANWRDARVDGDGNGEINAADIATIAGNWRAKLSGYRVYARAPSGDYTMLPNPDEPAPLTLHRPADRDNTLPVRYSFTYSLPDDATGAYQFYVAGYDLPSATEGPAGAALSINVETGQVNLVPIAQLTANPLKADPGTLVTLDAGGSYDPDGLIVDYLWDLDGNGVFDEPGVEAEARGSSQAMHMLGNQPGVYPVAVRVVDNNGAAGEAHAEPTALGWLFLTVDEDPQEEHHVGEGASLTVVNGRPAISYNHATGALKYAWSTSADGSAAWSTAVVETGVDVGKRSSLAEVNGRPAIAYTDNNLRILKYAWNVTIDDGGAWNTLAIPSEGLQGEVASPSLVMLANDLPAISYAIASPGKGTLRFAYSNVSDGSSGWSALTVDDDGKTGWWTSLAVVNGRPAIAYTYQYAVQGGPDQWYGTSGLRYAWSSEPNGSDRWFSKTLGESLKVIQLNLTVINDNPARGLPS